MSQRLPAIAPIHSFSINVRVITLPVFLTHLSYPTYVGMRGGRHKRMAALDLSISILYLQRQDTDIEIVEEATRSCRWLTRRSGGGRGCYVRSEEFGKTGKSLTEDVG